MTPEEIEKMKAENAKLAADLAAETAAKDKAIADKNKILGEKKDLMEMFSKEDKEGMTPTELKLAEEAEALRQRLEQESGERAKLEESIKSENESRNKAENDRIQKQLDERIAKVAKGDAAIADKLKANVALLDKMPRSTDAELDAIVNNSFNMLGTTESNPLNAMSSLSGGAPAIEEKPSYATTQEGKAQAYKLGLSHVASEGKEPEKAAPAVEVK